MADQILMPQLGEAVVEGRIVEWFVKPGDAVSEGTTLVEIETDKANTEVPATRDGFIGRILVAEGETVDVGTPLIEIVDSADGASDEPAAASTDDANDADDSGVEPAPALREPAPPAQAPARPAASNADSAGPDEMPWNANNIVAAPTKTPAALPIASRSSAGAQAMQAAAASGAFGAPVGGKYFRPPAVKAEDGDTVIPFSKRRGIIAEHMVYSKHVSPHVPCFAEIDVSAVSDLRRKHKARLAEKGIRLSLLAFVLKATCEALREYPGVNAVVGDDEIIQRAAVHLGVAVETPNGLLVPVIRDADKLSVSELAQAVDEVATRARNKKITVDELMGGTFTVTNPGRKGNLFGAAIINQPQVGILRMGEIRRRPVVREIDGEEAICIRSMMFAGLSYDHRIIDGVAGNGFLYEVRERLERAEFEV